MSGARYPILFTYRDILAGNGFVAGIEVRGRYLLADESEQGFWVYGVNPGGLSAAGHSEREATSAFREAYRETLFDIAGDATTFDDFKASISQFVHDENSYYCHEWWDAVNLVRSGKVDLDWLSKEKAESDLQVTVVELSKPVASQNRVDSLALAQAA